MSWSDRRRVLLAFTGAVALAGCGFQPMYATGGDRPGAAERLAQVDIANIPNRYGQQLRNNLIDRFYPHGRTDASPYELVVGLSATEQKLALRKDATAERAQLAVSAPYRLVEKATGRTLLSANSRIYVSYSVLEEQYASVVTVDNAYDRALAQISDEITTHVAAFLSRPQP